MAKRATTTINTILYKIVKELIPTKVKLDRRVDKGYATIDCVVVKSSR